MEDPKTDPKLIGLTPEMKTKAIGVLAQMKALGYQAHVAEGKRTLEEQQKKVEQGYSKTMHSKHLTGQAIDVVDKRWGWDASCPRRFWLHLGAAAISHGLGWGGFFGLSAAQKSKLRAALAAGRFDAAVSMKMGWDPAHCELVG